MPDEFDFSGFDYEGFYAGVNKPTLGIPQTPSPFQQETKKEADSLLEDILKAPFRGVVGAVQDIYGLGDWIFGDALPDWDENPLGESSTLVGGLVEGLANFTVGFLPGLGLVSKAGKGLTLAAKGARGAGFGVTAKAAAKGARALRNPIVKDFAAGAVADAVVFGAQEERVSNLIESLSGNEDIPIVEYLAASSEDGEVEGRFKNALEGALLGAGLGGLARVGMMVLKRFKLGAEALAQGKSRAEAAAIEEAGVPLADIQAEVAREPRRVKAKEDSYYDETFDVRPDDLGPRETLDPKRVGGEPRSRGADQIIRRAREDVKFAELTGAESQKQGSSKYVPAVEPEEARILEDFMDRVGRHLFDDVALSIRGNWRTTGAFYDHYKNLVVISRGAISEGQFNDATIHEMWHSMERYLPKDTVAAVTRTYDKTFKRFLSENPDLKDLKGSDWTPDNVYKKLLEAGVDDAVARERALFSYRFTNTSEFIAESAKDRSLKKLYALEDINDARGFTAVMKHVRFVLDELWVSLKAKFGGNQVDKMVDDFFNRRYDGAEKVRQGPAVFDEGLELRESGAIVKPFERKLEVPDGVVRAPDPDFQKRVTSALDNPQLRDALEQLPKLLEAQKQSKGGAKGAYATGIGSAKRVLKAARKKYGNDAVDALEEFVNSGTYKKVKELSDRIERNPDHPKADEWRTELEQTKRDFWDPRTGQAQPEGGRPEVQAEQEVRQGGEAQASEARLRTIQGTPLNDSQVKEALSKAIFDIQRDLKTIKEGNAANLFNPRHLEPDVEKGVYTVNIEVEDGRFEQVDVSPFVAGDGINLANFDFSANSDELAIIVLAQAAARRARNGGMSVEELFARAEQLRKKHGGVGDEAYTRVFSDIALESKESIEQGVIKLHGSLSALDWAAVKTKSSIMGLDIDNLDPVDALKALMDFSELQTLAGHVSGAKGALGRGLWTLRRPVVKQTTEVAAKRAQHSGLDDSIAALIGKTISIEDLDAISKGAISSESAEKILNALGGLQRVKKELHGIQFMATKKGIAGLTTSARFTPMQMLANGLKAYFISGLIWKPSTILLGGTGLGEFGLRRIERSFGKRFGNLGPEADRVLGVLDTELDDVTRDIRDSLQMMSLSLKTQRPILEGRTRADGLDLTEGRTITAENAEYAMSDSAFDWISDDWKKRIARFVGVVGVGQELGLRGMMAVDEFVKQYTYRAEVRTGVTSESQRLLREGKITADEYEDFVERSVNDILRNRSGKARLRAFSENDIIQEGYRKYRDQNGAIKSADQKLEADAFAAKYLADQLDADEFLQTRLDIADRAKKSARSATFQDTLPRIDGNFRDRFSEDAVTAIGGLVNQFRDKIPGAWLILPFVRTPTNLISRSLDRTLRPFAGLLEVGRQKIMGRTLSPQGRLLPGSRKFITELTSTDPVVKAEAFGRAMTATMTLSMTAMLAQNHFITGRGPSDPDERAILKQSGWQEYSFRIPGEDGKDAYISFKKLDPFATSFGLMADMVDTVRYSHDAGASDAQKVLQPLWASLALNFQNKSYLKGIVDILTGLTSEDPANKFWRIAQSYVGAAVPLSSAALGLAQVDDPYVKEVTDLLDPVLQRLPVFNEKLPPVRTVLGDPLKRSGGDLPWLDFTLPTAYSETGDSLVDRELAAIGHPFQPPSDMKDGVDLRQFRTEAGQDAYDRWMELSGKVTVNKKTLREALKETFRSQEYRALNSPIAPFLSNTKAQVVNSLLLKYRRAAFEQVQKEIPELARLFRQIEAIKAQSRTGALPDNVLELLPEF